MKRHLLKAILAICITSTVNASIMGHDRALDLIVNGSNKFSHEFFKAAANSTIDNLICSPLSVHMGLSMLAYGAKDKTEKELQNKLHLPIDKNLGKNGYQLLIDTLNNIKAVKLYLANKIFTAKNIELKSDYKELTKKYFRSEVQSLDFGKVEESTTTINKWCQEQTNNLIDEIIVPDDLKQVETILLNVVYFRGKWKRIFNPALTELMPFRINTLTTKRVPMMRGHGEYNFGRMNNFDARFIELPYQTNNGDEDISMFIIVPTKHNGLKYIEEKLHEVNFQKIDHITKNVFIFIPKFKIQSQLNIQTIGMNMGMVDTFGQKSNFSDISDSYPMIISKAIQKAVIEVNEEGTAAAAVTDIQLMTKSASANFMVDRPFICTIIMKHSGIPLFTARIVDPSLTTMQHKHE